MISSTYSFLLVYFVVISAMLSACATAVITTKSGYRLQSIAGIFIGAFLLILAVINSLVLSIEEVIAIKRVIFG